MGNNGDGQGWVWRYLFLYREYLKYFAVYMGICDMDILRPVYVCFKWYRISYMGFVI